MLKPGDCPEFTTAAVLPALIEVFRERGVDRLPTEEVAAAGGMMLERHARERNGPAPGRLPGPGPSRRLPAPTPW